MNADLVNFLSLIIKYSCFCYFHLTETERNVAASAYTHNKSSRAWCLYVQYYIVSRMFTNYSFAAKFTSDFFCSSPLTLEFFCPRPLTLLFFCTRPLTLDFCCARP